MASSLTDFENFEWLADLQKSQCYTTCDWANPAKSTDFGSNGYTTSLTDWHELLQLTAPHKDCGIVFVRGSFPNTPDAILSRAQRRDDTGSKGTFGLHLLHESAAGDVAVSQDDEKESIGCQLGARRAQGLANFRWPYMQYELKRQEWSEKRSGTYEVISFVKDGTMFQIIRLSPGILTKKGPGRYAQSGHDAQQIKFRVGGQVQFGCPCSNGADQSSKKDFNMRSTNGGLQLIYESKEYKHRLEIQVFVDGRHNIITASESLSAGILEVRVSSDEPTIIVSTYTLRDLSDSDPNPDDYPMIPMVSSRQIEDYLGVSNISVEMTDKLWLASLTTQFDAIETIELCAVARCVEQILGVSSVPIPSSNSTASSDLTDHTAPADFDNVSGIALICNIMTSQHVDLESTFWQIRFLVKSHEFLASRTFEQSFLEFNEIEYLVQMRTAYLMRIRRHIQLALVWMTRAQVKIDKILLPIEPGHASTGLKMRDHSGRERAVKIDSSYNQACFTRIAVWYVMKYCKAAMTSEFRTYIQANGLGALPHPDEWSEPKVDKESTPKNDVVLWFDVSCLLLLWQELHPEDNSPNILEARQRILRSLEHRENIVKRLRKSQSEPYSMDDEELDRLFLLGEELGLPSGTSASLATARAEHTRSRIAMRTRTEIFNCGPRARNGRRSTRITSHAPWELACLNHHSLLKTSLDPTKDVNPSQSRDACFEFFLSDYTFMVSWDRADKSMIGKWWDIEPASVICATLLDLIGKSKRHPALSNRPTEDLSRTQINMTQSAFGANQMARGLEEAVRELVVQLQSKQDTPLSGGDFRTSPRGFDWLRCKPGKIYHLKSWVQSLDDTPEVFHSMQTTFTPLRRGLIKYLTGDDSSESPKAPEYKRDTIYQMITADSLEFLSTFDFKLNDDFIFTKEQISLMESDKESHQMKLLTSLNDCLVDRGTKYKILFVTHNTRTGGKLIKQLYRFAEKCCQEVASAFVYIWHPDALDTFSNYFSTISHFADTREALWTSTITLSHWKLLPTNISTDSSDPFHEGKENAGRTNGIFPPKKVTTSEVATSEYVLEERSSSLVITGDANGYNWICTIWSSLTDFKSIKNSIKRLPEILQLFIHQQASGRCIVFLIILEHICEKLASEYSRILEHLDSIVELGGKVLFEGLEWEVNDPIDKLKRMIWGGQALRVLDDRLSASLSQIHNAKEAMDHTIKQDEGQQHIELLQEYTNVLEGFGKRFSILSNVQVRIQLKIKHITGLRDGISTVTNVQDSRTALGDSKITIKQGNNIRILTLITIAYLPLGYVASLFSENHGILPENANGNLYAGLVVAFMVGTYGLALSLGKILNFFEPKWRKLKWYIGLDNAGSWTEDGRFKEQSSSGEAGPMNYQDGSSGSEDKLKVSTGRATGFRGWAGRKRAGHDAGTQLELV